jgi:hypothetical protein
MSVVVGTLTVDLIANTASFVGSMDKAGQISLTSAKNIEKAFKAMATGVITAVTAVSAAVAAMVDGSLTNMARLADMSQSTGVTTEALSALEYAAKQSGLGAESLDKALEKMAKSMLKAADSSTKGTNAYKSLGISVTDAQGKLRPTVDVIEDLAAKFEKMKDGPMKTALAMQIFGKAGAEMVPFLNRGRGGITELIAEAKKLGLVIDQDSADAAKHFEESMNKLKASATGAANKLTTDLLPAMQQIMDNVSAGYEESNNLAAGTMMVFGAIGKGLVTAYSLMQLFFEELSRGVGMFETDMVMAFTGVAKAVDELGRGHFAGAVQAVKDADAAMLANHLETLREFKQSWADYASGVDKFWNAKVSDGHGAAWKPKPGKDETPKTKDANAGKEQEKIEKRISDLQKQAAMEIAVAAAQGQGIAATIEATAAAQALEFIEKANADLKQKHAGALTSAQKATILIAEGEKAYAAVAKETSKVLGETATKTKEQTAATLEMTVAYSKGGAAIAEAQQRAQMAPFIEKVEQLQAAFEKLSKDNPKATKEIAALATALDNARTSLSTAKHAFDDFADAQRRANTDRQATDLERETAAVRGYAVAILGGVDALRAYDIQQKLIAYQSNATFDQSTDAVNKFRDGLKQLYDAQDQRAISDKIHSANTQSDLLKEIALLKQRRDIELAAGRSTLVLDGLIRTADLQRHQQLVNQLLATDSLKNGFHAFFAQYANDGTTAAQRVDQVMTQTMGNFNTTLITQLAEGKADWKAFARTAVESIGQIALKQLEAYIMSSSIKKAEKLDAAKTAFHNTYASVSEWPFVGPALAPVLAAGAFAAVMAFREGGIVPGSGSDGVPALLHPREMVLPERVAKTVTDAVGSSSGGNSKAAFAPVYSPVIHLPPGASAASFEQFIDGHFRRWASSEARRRGMGLA